MSCRYGVCGILAAFFLSCSVAAAQEQVTEGVLNLKLKVPHTSTNLPVHALVKVPKEFGKTSAVLVHLAGGKAIPGQLARLGLVNYIRERKRDQSAKTDDGIVRELHFVLPAGKAGQTLQLTAKLSTKEPQLPSYAWGKSTGKHLDLQFQNRKVLRYMHEKLDNSTKQDRHRTYKVYHHLFDPAGKRLVTKGHGGLFPHHRGLFYGFNRISYGDKKRADVWHCNRGESQQHAAFLASEAGPVMGRQRSVVTWHGQDGTTFAVEEREMTVYNVPGGNLVEFASQLRSLVGPVKLDGDPQHAGFQFRASQDVPDKTAKLTYYLRPDGKDKPGSYRNWSPRKGGKKTHKNLPWNAMSIVLDEKRYTACYLDHPQNPKESRYSERNYGRFGSYFEYQLDKGKPLTINYRLWFQQGEMTVAQVQKLRDDFVKGSQLTK